MDLNFSKAINRTAIDIVDCNILCLFAKIRHNSHIDDRILKLKNKLKTKDAKDLARAILDKNYKPTKEEIVFLAEHIKKWVDNKVKSQEF